jgi:iron complex transport system substrate-binding protein
MDTPARIVSLISSATEILYLLGLGNRVVGVSHECDYPPEIAGKPRLTRSLVDAAASSRAIDDQVRSLSQDASALYEIDVEQLASLVPDLIITQAQCDVCAVRYQDVLEAVQRTPELTRTQVLALNPRSIADVLADISRIGQATAAANAQRAIAALESRIDTVRNTTAGKGAPTPRVACLEWLDPPMLAANWMPELIGWAGGDASATRPGEHSSYARWEDIVRFDPQVIVIMPCGFDLPRAIHEAQVLPALEGWSQLSAVRDGRVYVVDGNAYFNRSGPRLVDSLEILAHLFHPEHVPPPSIHPRAWQRLETREGSLCAEES